MENTLLDKFFLENNVEICTVDKLIQSYNVIRDDTDVNLLDCCLANRLSETPERGHQWRRDVQIYEITLQFTVCDTEQGYLGVD